MSGHNKWSSIKHRKGAQDAKRGRIFTRLIKEITVAARMGGGDPDANPRLRRAMDAAKAENMPADNMTRAVKKGTGELEGVSYEELTYEGTGPGGTLIAVDVVTDNRNRTQPEIRKIFDRYNGQLGQPNSALWAFEDKGLVELDRDAATEEQLFETAVGAGAEDVEASDERWIITTPRESLDDVRAALDQAEIPVRSADFDKIPKVRKPVGGHDAETLMKLLDALEDHDDVQKIYADFELSDEAAQQLQASS